MAAEAIGGRDAAALLRSDAAAVPRFR